MASGRWNKSLVIGALRAWAALYGAPPTEIDWNPALARKRGRQDILDRYYAAKSSWPSYRTTLHYFANWNAAVRAAGFTPRRPSRCQTSTPLSKQAAEALAELKRLSASSPACRSRGPSLSQERAASQPGER